MIPFAGNKDAKALSSNSRTAVVASALKCGPQATLQILMWPTEQVEFENPDREVRAYLEPKPRQQHYAQNLLWFLMPKRVMQSPIEFLKHNTFIKLILSVADFLCALSSSPIEICRFFVFFV